MAKADGLAGRPDASSHGVPGGPAEGEGRPAGRAPAGWRRRWRWTLPRRLLVGITLCLLPLVLLLGEGYLQRYAARRADELGANRQVAEAVAGAFEAYVRDLDHQLRAVGFAVGRLDLDNYPLVQAYLTLNRAPYPALAVLALADADGRVIAADPPDLVGAALAGEGYLQSARASSDAVVSDLLSTPGDTAPWFAVARAVHRINGEPAGVLVAYVDARALGGALSLGRLDRWRSAVLDRRGRVVYDNEHPDLPWAQRDASALTHVRQALAGQTATSEQFIGPADAAPRLGAAAPIAGLGWVATADRPLSEALGPIEATARQEGVLLLIVLGLVLLLAAFLAYMLTQPLRALEAAVAAVRRGDYARRVAVHGSDEVADLAASFNAMAERLEALEQERVAFAAMVAHDLRSPLTAVRGTAQILQRRGDDDPDLQRGLETIVRETDRVARLAADFGDAVNAAAGQLELRPARVDLVELVVEAVERLKAAGTAQPIALDAVPQSIRVDADPQRIAQVLDNLLGNAAKYSPSDQPIAVQVRTNGEARVSVQDRGPGIAPEDLPRLFERFYRTRTARRGSKGGSGLGLYISQRIAAAHGGRLRAESTLGAGSCFTLILPLPRAGGGPPPRSADGPPLR